MTKYLYLFIFVIACYISGFAAPGDDCTTAIAVSSNGCSAATAFDNTGITGTLAAPSCFTTGNNNGMWFQFVATTKIVNITANGSTLTQPQIALLQPAATGCSGTFTELVCNSSGTAVSTVNYSNLTIGNTYYIYVDGRNNLVGNFQLCLNSPIAPANDNPCNPIVVPANNYCSGANVFTNIGASSDNLISASIPACWTTTGAYNTVYFQFTALGSYNAITVSGNLNSPQIAIISTANCNGTTWTNNGASNCASSNTNTVTMNANNLTVGQTYLIAVDGKIDNVGTFQLCVNSYAPTTGPSNDQCLGAISLCNGFASGSTVGATATNDINIGRWSCNGVLDNPVWFKFDAATPVQPVVLGLNGTCTGDALQVEVFRFTGTSGPCTPANSNQFTSIGCNNSITGSGTSTLTIPAANMVAGQTYYILVDNWPGQTCNFSFTISGISATNAGVDQNLCISQSPINLVGTPAGGTWSGTGITNPALGTFNPQVAGIGTHVLYYTTANCSDEKIINVTGPQVVTSNDVSICGGSTQLTGSVNLYPQNSLVQFTNTTDYNIPDNNATGVSSIISVSGVTPNTVATNPIQKVCMNIGHSYDGDLDVFLICPGGTQIELTTDNGGGGDGYSNTCFVASGTSIASGAAPFTGSFTPEQPFTNLNACNINGNWTLKVVDDAGSDIGTLLDWSIYFNQQNSVNYVWSPTTNMTNPTTLNPTVSPTTNTTYYLTATDNNSCIAKDSVRVSIGGSIAGPDQSICLTKSTTFASSGTGTWTPLATNPAVVTIQSNTNPTSNIGPFNTVGVYNFEWNAGGCKDTVKITVNTPPVANAGLDMTINCTTTSIQIGTAAVAGITYTWTPTTGLSNPNIAQPTASQAGTFTVTATNSTTGCFSTDAMTVIQSATLPVANAGIDKTLTCTTTTVQIGTTAVSGINYTWTPTNGLSNPNIAQPTASQAGTFTITATDPNTGCSSTDAVTITQDITPPTANAGIDAILNCSTTIVTIGTVAIAGTTYTWSPTNGLSNPNIAQPTASQAGTFTITATNTTNGCTATDAVTITQNITPPTANAGTDKNLNCTATSVQIGTTAVAGTTYTWSPTNGLSNPNIAQPTASQAGTFTVTATNTTNGCIATDAVMITQNITPPTANAGTDKILTCTTTSVQIGTTAVAGITYTWSPTNGLSNPNIAQPTASQAGTFTVTVTNTTNGCTATDAVTITQNITPPTANAGTDKNLNCTTTSVQIGTTAVAGITYSWSPTNGLSNPNIAQPTASQAGTFTVTATNTTNGCTATDAIMITQNTTPPTANAGTDKNLNCTATSVQIGTTAVAGTTYTWSPTNGLSNPNIAQPTASQAGTFTVTATNTTNGCTATDAVTITQNITPPTANAGTDKILTCTTTSVQIGTTAVAGITYTWSPTNGLSNPNIAQPTASQAGTFTVTATNTTNGCTTTDAVTITQNITPPTANAGTDKILTCTTTSVQIGTTAVAGIAYTWSPTNGLSNPNIAQPTASQAGTFTITATNTTNGCTATDAVTITQNITPPTANAGTDKNLNCTTTSVQIGTTAVAGITYSWSPTNGLSNPNIAQPTASQAGTFTVTATNTTNGCTATDAVTITQSAVPPTANAGVDKILTCTTTSVQIGTTAIAGITYSWSPTNGLSNPNIAQPTASQAGTFTVTATNTSNGCLATDAVTITQDVTPPTANAGLDKTLTCTVTSIQIGTPSIAGTTYSWSPTNGLSNPNIAQPIASQTGTFTLTATNTTNGCTAIDAVTITRSGAFPIANAGSDKTLTCSTTSVSIGMSPIAGINYTWTPTNGLSNPNIAQPTASQPGTFTLTATDPLNGCISTDDVVISQNNTTPTVDAGIDKELTCATTSVLIGTTAIAGITYIWSPTNGLSNPNIAQPTASQTGTFTLTATNTTNGCTATDAVTITQNTTPPVANAGLDKTLTCATTSVLIGTTAVVGTTYSWLPTNGLSNPNIAQPSASQPGTFTVTATNTSNGCITTDAVSVTQNITAPVANAGIDKTLTCTTTSVQIGTAAIAGTIYSWSPTNGLSNPNIAQPTASQPSTFIVTATNISNGCTATDAVTITQNITPPIANAGIDKNLNCTTTSVQIGTTTIAGTTYSWSPTNGLSNPNIAQSTASQPGTFIVTATNTTNGCTTTDAITITQDITPPVANAGSAKTLTCTTTSVQIGGSSSVAGINYVWSPTNGLTNPNIAQTSTTQPGIYTLTTTNPVNGCTSSSSVSILQNITPPIADAGIDKIITCTAINVNIGTPAISNTSYTWSPSIGLSSVNIAQPNANKNGIYTVTATNNINGCTASNSVIVSIDTLKPIANAGIDKELTCATSSVSIGSNSITGINYSWSPASGLIFGGIISKPDAILPNTYTITALNPLNGCINTDDVTVSQNISKPLVDAGEDKTLTCTTNFVTIGTPAIAGLKYTWTPPIGLNVTNIAQPTANDSGMYIVTALDPTNGCTATDTVAVLLNRPYTDLELGPDQTIYQEESATITATGAITSGSIIWTPTSTLSCGNCITTVASPITTTSYFVSYKNPDECVTLDTITVNVIPIVGLFFPSAFSPNKDGINDEFLALGDSVKAYELSIYNRWGELLFTTTDRYATWNGIYNGSEQPTDSYVYVAHATLYNNKKKDYNGTFSLLR